LRHQDEPYDKPQFFVACWGGVEGMLWSAWISVLVAVLATVVAAISLILSRRSLDVSRKLLLTTASTQGTTELASKADELFLSDPGLRPYFYDRWPAPEQIFDSPAPVAGEPSKADLFRSRLLAATEYYLDLLESIWDNVGPLPEDDKSSWREWIHDMFESGPILGAYRERYETWYPTLTGMLRAEVPEDLCSDPEKHPYAAKLQSHRPEPALEAELVSRLRFWRWVRLQR
jgi:hypothetical protein